MAVWSASAFWSDLTWSGRVYDGMILRRDAGGLGWVCLCLSIRGLQNRAPLKGVKGYELMRHHKRETNHWDISSHHFAYNKHGALSFCFATGTSISSSTFVPRAKHQRRKKSRASHRWEKRRAELGENGPVALSVAVFV